MKTITMLTSTIQPNDLLRLISASFKRLSQYIFLQTAGSFSKLSSQPPFSSRMGMQQFKRNFKKNYVFLIPVVVVFVLIIVLIGNFLSKDTHTGSVQGAQDSRAKINKPLAIEEVNRSFTFSSTNQSEKVTKVKFEIQNVELRDQIVLRGQPYVAVQGREFLIINLKIVNDSKTNLSMQTQDYVRLIVDGSSDKLAPDINNDPVQIQAISTKLTRVGFAIDDTAKKLVLQVGEIDGKKDTIELHLQK